ncbi:class I SAM-dependent methyltransferase [Bosea sp. Root381]|uniref:class I SAM-dependent methyltransferase n=1 Tax=Bosea sp. Root381 TaxID=1736524 RepID=UPI0009EA5EDE|nr:class I SAM-dependent methyltransferase [Bosea sp. Root381]
MDQDSLATLDRYLTEQYVNVEGWCWEYNWQPIQFLAQRQSELSQHIGPVAEIGVFHGKFFIGLNLLKAKSRFTHTVIDVFDMQQFSMSGEGKRIRVPKNISDQQLDKFKFNAVSAGIDVDALCIIKSDSTNLLSREIEAAINNYSKFSFFSVDGCHEFTHAYSDLNLAMEMTDHNGIIFMDDYLHARWPGVHEAVAKMMFCGAPRFVPLYYVHNKLAMCHVNLHNDYLEGLFRFLTERHPATTVRRVTRYGWPTLTIEPKSGSPVLAL